MENTKDLENLFNQLTEIQRKRLSNIPREKKAKYLKIFNQDLKVLKNLIYSNNSKS